MLTGTIVNALAILVGSAAGLLLTALAHRFSKALPAGSAALGSRLQTIIMQGVALCVLFLGISGSLKGQNSLIAILSMVIGALIGEPLDLDNGMHRLGDWVQSKSERFIKSRGDGPSVSDGFVTASLLFCVGAMAIVGALQDGLTGDHSIMFAKSIMDFFTAVIFGATSGYMVGLIAIPQCVVFLALFFMSRLLMPLMTAGMIGDFKAVGGIITLALGLKLSKIRHYDAMNLLPAIILVFFISYLWGLLPF